MTLNITIPQLNSNSKSTKDMVISLLSQKWPLNAMEIYNSVQREFGAGVSYQAVHKILNELQQGKILEKNGMSYQISKGWIEQVKKFGSDLDEKYTNGKTIDFENFESMHITMDKFLDFCRFMIYEFYMKFPNPEKKDCICSWDHVYSPIGMSEKDHEILRDLFSTALHYAPCPNNTFLDNWFAEYLNDLGKICVNDVQFSVGNDTFVQGDFVMVAYFSSEFKKNVDEIYKKVKSVEEFKVSNYFDIINKKAEINILIVKNSSLAGQLRKEGKMLYECKGEAGK